MINQALAIAGHKNQSVVVLFVVVIMSGNDGPLTCALNIFRQKWHFLNDIGRSSHRCVDVVSQRGPPDSVVRRDANTMPHAYSFFRRLTLFGGAKPGADNGGLSPRGEQSGWAVGHYGFSFALGNLM